ncbi:MAG TPA: FAD-binding oxidoreductase [Vicinamibacteria bacterium]
MHRSLWLLEVPLDPGVRPPLEGDLRADVAIAGGGYVGLWTALLLKEREPALDVAIVEQDFCGSGASGRNGGFALSWWAKLKTLTRLCGQEDGVRLAQASETALSEIESFCGTHGIDAHFTRGGWLWTATTPSQLGSWEACVALAEKLGVGPWRRIGPEEMAGRTGSSAHLGGVLDTSAATVQPAALALGLRRAALEAGVRIYERSPIVDFDRGSPPALLTERGRLRAEKVVVATNAWAARFPELRRALVVLSSDIVATSPISESLERIGWTGGEAITDSQLRVDYYRTTRDGRIAFGKGAGAVALSGRMGPEFDRNPRAGRDAEADLRAYYPSLGGVSITHQWSGPIDKTMSGIPLFGRLGGREHVLYGVGFSGNGVGPSRVGGKILRSLALGLRDDWSECPLVEQRFERFPPEPFCYLAARLVRGAVVRKETAELRGRKARSMDVRIAALAPAGLEDK